MKLTQSTLFKALCFALLVSSIISIESDLDRAMKRKVKIRKTYLKNFQAAANVDEKKVIIYRILSYDSKLSLILINAGLLPKETKPETVTNTNIINQLREFLHNFNDAAGLTDLKTEMDKSLTDGFKALKEKYKFEYKNTAAPPASRR